MDFTYTEEQKILKDSARNFLAKVCYNVEWHLKMDKDEKGYTPELWNGMANLGWMGILIPEEYGGTGGHLLDVVTLMEEMGYAAVPGPYFSTIILAGTLILAAGNDAQKEVFLGKIAEGALVMTLAMAEPVSTAFEPSLITMKAEPEDDFYIINGIKLFVTDANISDWMVVVTRTKGEDADKDGITLFLVDAKSKGIEVNPLRTVAGDKQCEVIFNKVMVPKTNILGGLNKGWPYLEKTLAIATVAKCAEMLGGSNKVMELAVSYAKERVQFGKQIGTYQAVQHHCANMKIAIEQSIYITYKAAWMVDHAMPESHKYAAIAKIWVSDASKKVAAIGHQIFGGTGYIVEHEMPIYSRRAKGGEYAFGSPIYHREIVVQDMGL